MAMPRRTPTRTGSPNGPPPAKPQKSQASVVKQALRETTVSPRGSYARATWKAT
jgi:hypothetical protein